MDQDEHAASKAKAPLEADVFGTWRLVSMRIQVAGDDAPGHGLFGPDPFGRAIFTPDHYGIGYIARSNRKPASNDAEAAALLRSMIAYTGRFRIDGDRMITAVDGAWSEDWNGTEQVRFIRLEGDTLTLTTPEQPSRTFGKPMVGTLVWRRET